MEMNEESITDWLRELEGDDRFDHQELYQVYSLLKLQPTSVPRQLVINKKSTCSDANKICYSKKYFILYKRDNYKIHKRVN